MNLENTIEKAKQILKKSNIMSPDLDAEIILADIMGLKRESLITRNDKSISKTIIKKYNDAINRRACGEPVAYITGKREFWSQEFIVNKSTLVPRPETELLIYKIIDFFKEKSINILDIGTGSGCILLSILKELSLSRGIGIDISPKAIQIAKKNAFKLNLLNRVKFKIFDINQFSHGKYNLVVSNPPYIPLKDIKNLSKDIINYEPKAALNGGHDGLDLIKNVIYKSSCLLTRDGLLVLEIGNNQYKRVSAILRINGFREKSKVFDYKQNVRCIISTKMGFF